MARLLLLLASALAVTLAAPAAEEEAAAPLFTEYELELIRTLNEHYQRFQPSRLAARPAQDERRDLLQPLDDELIGDAKVTGIFSGPCQSGYIRYINNSQSYIFDFSSVSTSSYGSNNEYQLDWTDYIRDPHCKPGQGEVLGKHMFYGAVDYYGENREFKGANKITIKMDHSTHNFPPVLVGNGIYITDLLNKVCPCNGTWVPGKTRNVSAADCNAVPTTQMFMCELIAGNTYYGNWEWTSSARDAFYESVYYPTKVEGWAQPPNHTLQWEKIPESGNHHPEECDYINFGFCEPHIEVAASNCVGCQGIECAGCIFRDLPAQNEGADYELCCPCLYAYANSHAGHDFLKVDC